MWAYLVYNYSLAVCGGVHRFSTAMVYFVELVLLSATKLSARYSIFTIWLLKWFHIVVRYLVFFHLRRCRPCLHQLNVRQPRVVDRFGFCKVGLRRTKREC